MSELLVLQRSFQGFLLEGSQGIEQLVSGEDAGARLGIYAEAYRLRLLEALSANYPKLRRMLGDDAFEHLGREYLAGFPSDNPNIRWFGCRLGEFLASVRPYRGQPVLAEMARFEWALTEIFDAAEVSSLSEDAIAAISPTDWPGLSFVPHSSLRRLDLQWTVPQLWLAIEKDEPAEPAPPVRNQYPVGWVLWRREFRHYWRSLDIHEAWALDAMCRGARLDELCAGLCEWIDPAQVAGQAAELIRRWVHDGLVSSVRKG